jgi:hypothetical protein
MQNIINNNLLRTISIMRLSEHLQKEEDLPRKERYPDISPTPLLLPPRSPSCWLYGAAGSRLQSVSLEIWGMGIGMK